MPVGSSGVWEVLGALPRWVWGLVIIGGLFIVSSLLVIADRLV